MTDSIPALADQAADAIHQLAVLSRPAITPLDIHDLHTTIGALAELTAALPQTLRQLERYLDHIEHAHLKCATQAATQLAGALDAAHQALGEAAEKPTPNHKGVNFQPAKRGQNSNGVDSTVRGARSHPPLRAAGQVRTSPVKLYAVAMLNEGI